MQHEKELAAAAAGLESVLSASGAKGLVGEEKALDLCATYHKAKPWLEGIAKVLDVIPIPWAGTLAKGLRLLMTLADTACPA